MYPTIVRVIIRIINSSFLHPLPSQSSKDVVLHVKMGIPGERCYYPPEELVWDASRDSSPRSLRTCLAAHYGLSPDCLLLAKHHPDKHIWEEISNWVILDKSHLLRRSLFNLYTCALLFNREIRNLG